MKRVLLIAIIVLMISGTALMSLAKPVEKPSRSDCTAGARLLWPEGDADRTQILNQIANVDPLGNAYPTAGLSQKDRELIYIIFSSECKRRNVMMGDIMTAYKERIKGFPEFLIIEGRINPSSDSINVYGSYWSDGEPPEDIFVE